MCICIRYLYGHQVYLAALVYSVIHFFTFPFKAGMMWLKYFKIFGRESYIRLLSDRSIKITETSKYTNFIVHDKNGKRIKKPHSKHTHLIFCFTRIVTMFNLSCTEMVFFLPVHIKHVCIIHRVHNATIKL